MDLNLRDRIRTVRDLILRYDLPKSKTAREAGVLGQDVSAILNNGCVSDEKLRRVEAVVFRAVKVVQVMELLAHLPDDLQEQIADAARTYNQHPATLIGAGERLLQLLGATNA